MDAARRARILLASAAAGAAGLGLEAIALSASGLLVGHARAAAFGLGLFVAGWALGARRAGRSSGDARRSLVAVGAAACALGVAAPAALFGAARGAGPVAASALAVLFVVAIGFVQGHFLPLLARLDERAEARGVAGLWSASLAGSVAGAWALGDQAVLAFGRPIAGALAGALALFAALVGAVRTRAGDAPAAPGGRSGAGAGAGLDASLGATLAVATLWTIALEWIVLRLGVLWMGGLQVALTSILAATLIALFAGAALLPRVLHRGRRGALELAALSAVLSLWPLVAGRAVPGLLERGGLPAALALVGPTVFGLGAFVPVLFRAGSGEAGRRLGDLFAWEALGALAAGPLVHLWLVPAHGLGGAIGALALSACAVALLSFGAHRSSAVATFAVGAVAALVAGSAREPALDSPQLTDPALTVRAFTEDPSFAVSVVDDGVLGERTLLTDAFRAAGTGRDYRYMQVLGHLPVVLHPAPRRVAVLALGTGTTVGAVSLHPAEEVERIDVLEISPAVVAMAPWFEAVNHGALRDAGEGRVRVLLGDGRRTLASSAGAYDVVTIEPLLPDSPFGVYLYTREFYALARRALAPGGLVCQWVPPHALEPDVFEAVVDAFVRSFPESGVWVFGTQVILLGGQAIAGPDAARLPDTGSPAGAALAALGLGTPAGLAARRVADGDAWPEVERPLTDADPWVAYRPKPTGAVVLDWLPENLRRTFERSTAPAEGGRGSEGKSELSAALRAARLAHARAERDVRRGRVGAAEARAAVRAALARIPAADDPEARALAAEADFLFALREGVSRLAVGDSRAAADLLLTAAELRPERGDVHVYVAAALAGLGLDRGARAALDRATETCPRILETPAGRRALDLGLADWLAGDQAP